MQVNKIFLYSLSSLAVIAAASASAEEFASAPSLEGGFSAMIGTMYMVPSVNDQAYGSDTRLIGSIPGGGPATQDLILQNNTMNFDGDYDFGIQAAIGYVFDNTANGIELSYRNFDSSTDGSIPGFEQQFSLIVLPGGGIADSNGFDTNQDNRFENFDLMFSQFLDIGTHVQMRFLGGISYLSELEQTTSANGDFGLLLGSQFFFLESNSEIDATSTSTYSGLGPRVGLDARYDFGPGFGIVGGGSVAYFLGNLDTQNNVNADIEFLFDSIVGGAIGAIPVGVHATDTNNNHAVTNLRANLGIDYVVYFEEQDLPTLGLELGYEVDAYLNGISTISPIGGEVNVTDATFSGPYLNLKGVF